MLNMASDRPLVSPLADLADGPVGPAGAQLADWSGRLVLDVRGRAGLTALRGVFDTVLEVVGDSSRFEHGILARLRPDRWLYIALAGDGEHFADQLNGAAVIDGTHAYGILHLRGAHGPDVLAQLCALDFDDRAFPDGRTAQTSLAKVPALVVRLDDDGPAYLVLIGRSVAAYAWTQMAITVKQFEAFAL